MCVSIVQWPVLISLICFVARNRAVVGEREATGEYRNISLSGWDIYNFYSNQVVEVISLPDGRNTYVLSIDYFFYENKK